jgi:hypothetical protein
MERLVIASAAKFETTHLVNFLEHHNVPYTRIVTGIGWSESSMIASRTRDLIADRNILFIGTGGILGKFQEPHLYSVQSVSVSSFDIRSGSTELLAPFDKKIMLKSLDFKLPSARIVCSLGITVSEETTPPNEQLTIENIELYAVSRAWNECAKSLTALIATTNSTGPNSRESWKLNYIEAAKLTSDFIGPKLIPFTQIKEPHFEAIR